MVIQLCFNFQLAWQKNKPEIKQQSNLSLTFLIKLKKTSKPLFKWKEMPKEQEMMIITCSWIELMNKLIMSKMLLVIQIQLYSLLNKEFLLKLKDSKLLKIHLQIGIKEQKIDNQNVLQNKTYGRISIIICLINLQQWLKFCIYLKIKRRFLLGMDYDLDVIFIITY